jgi:hypothetical protein
MNGSMKFSATTLLNRPHPRNCWLALMRLWGHSPQKSMPHFSLGLIQENEFKEITLIRKIRNEFGHGWKPSSFESGRIADLCHQLPWLGPAEHEAGATIRARFNFTVAILLTDLLWRVRLVSKERCTLKMWPNKTRGA